MQKSGSGARSNLDGLMAQLSSDLFRQAGQGRNGLEEAFGKCSERNELNAGWLQLECSTWMDNYYVPYCSSSTELSDMDPDAVGGGRETTPYSD